MLGGGSNYSTDVVAQAVIQESIGSSVPSIVEQGVFPVKSLAGDWASTNVLTAKYCMKTSTFILGSPADSSANVVPNISATYSSSYIASGRCEANVLYHKRKMVGGLSSNNYGAMHESEVAGAFNEYTRAMARKVNFCLLNSYTDPIFSSRGLNGLNDWSDGQVIGASLDPSDFTAVYDFFATQIDTMMANLQISASDITLCIARNAVIAMDRSLITGTSDSIWTKLKQFVLSQVRVFIFDTYYMDNSCKFVATNYAAVCKPNESFFAIKPEKDADGNEQFTRYIEYVLPSMLVTNPNAYIYKNNLFTGVAKAVNRSSVMKNVSPAKSKAKKSEKVYKAKRAKKGVGKKSKTMTEEMAEGMTEEGMMTMAEMPMVISSNDGVVNGSKTGF